MLHPRGQLTIWSPWGGQVPKLVGHDEGISQYIHHFDPLKQPKHTINHIQHHVQAQFPKDE